MVLCKFYRVILYYSGLQYRKWICAVLYFSWRRTKDLLRIWQKENSLFQSFTASRVIWKTIRSWISFYTQKPKPIWIIITTTVISSTQPVHPRGSKSKKSKVLPKPHGAVLISVSYSPQPDTSLHCEATNTGLVYRTARMFTPQLSPVPSYTAWWQRHIGVRNLPRVFTP